MILDVSMIAQEIPTGACTLKWTASNLLESQRSKNPGFSHNVPGGFLSPRKLLRL
jgi:hypothetical protein